MLLGWSFHRKRPLFVETGPSGSNPQFCIRPAKAAADGSWINRALWMLQEWAGSSWHPSVRAALVVLEFWVLGSFWGGTSWQSW